MPSFIATARILRTNMLITTSICRAINVHNARIIKKVRRAGTRAAAERIICRRNGRPTNAGRRSSPEEYVENRWNNEYRNVRRGAKAYKDAALFVKSAVCKARADVEAFKAEDSRYAAALTSYISDVDDADGAKYLLAECSHKAFKDARRGPEGAPAWSRGYNKQGIIKGIHDSKRSIGDVIELSGDVSRAIAALVGLGIE
jgi:hypothetical protein